MDTVGQAGIGPQTNALPAELRALPHWCVAGASKAPLTSALANASVTRPETWMTYEQAVQVALANQALVTTHTDSKGNTFSQTGLNIGFVFTGDDPFTCIDLDYVNDQTQRAMGQPVDPAEWTTAEDVARFNSIVAHMDSYTERSRSGFGLHIIAKGDIGAGRRKDGVEVYSRDRFLICTGNVWLNRPVADRQDMLANMVKQMPMKKPEVELWGDPVPNQSLAHRASIDGGELGKLWRGDWRGRYPSQSEADLALAKLLRPHTQTPAECWATFLLSQLGARPKAKRASYARPTMALAEHHLENDAAQVEHGKALVEAMNLNQEQADAKGFFFRPTRNPEHFEVLYDKELAGRPRPRWLVKKVIPETGIGVIYGDSGTFKSFLTLDLLAHIAHGREWFGFKVRPAPTIYIPYEGQGGVPKRVEAWRLAETQRRLAPPQLASTPADDALTNIGVIVEPLKLREQADRDKLVKTLTDRGEAGGVLCIDTLAHASAGLDENSSEMGEMITALQDLQRRLGGVVLVVHHSGKDPTKGMRGWTGIRAAMDFIIFCERPDRDVRPPEATFILEKVKDGDDGRSLSFMMSIQSLYQDEDGEWETSLTVVPTPQNDDREQVAPSKPTKQGINAIDAQTAAADNDFIFEWVRREVAAKNFPSKNSLKGQLPDMKETYEITQDRVLAAAERLLSEGRLTWEKVLKSPSGNVWLRPVEYSPTGET